MKAVRRTATASSFRSLSPLARPAPRIEDALVDPNRPAHRGEIVQMAGVDRLNDSLEDIWPGLAAETERNRLNPPALLPARTGPWQHPQSVLDVLAAQKVRKPQVAKPKADKPPKAPREPKVAKPRKPRATKAAVVEAPAPVATAPAPVPTPAPARRATLGQRSVAPAPLPTAAKRVVEGSSIPAVIVGVVALVATFRASTGEALVVDVEGQNNVARGLVVWAGPLQDAVRTAAAAGRPVRLAVRQPANPRFKPAIVDIASA